MSTEGNSSDKTPDATLAALAGKLRLPAGVTGDADTLPKGTFSTNPEPHGYPGLEEAAFKFIHDQQRADTSATPALKLVSPEEDPALAQAKSDKAAKLVELDAEIAQTPEGPAKEELRRLRKELESATTKHAISAAIASVSAATSGAVGKVETPEQKVERLWGEIKELNKKVDSAFEDLKAKGVVFDEEDEKKREELKKRIAAGDITAQAELIKLEAQMVEKAKPNHPELSKEFGEAEKLLKERESAFRERIETEKKLKTKTAEEIEMDEKKFTKDTEWLKGNLDIQKIRDDMDRQAEQLRKLKRLEELARTDPKESVLGPIVSVALNTTEAAAAKTAAITPSVGDKPSTTLDFSS